MMVETMVKEEDLMTVREAAEYLGISPATIRDWIRRKRIATYKPEIGRLAVDVNEIQEKLTPRKREQG
jgi:excisionase family DNA binding protein